MFKQYIRFCQRAKEMIWYLLVKICYFYPAFCLPFPEYNILILFREIPHCRGVDLATRTTTSRFGFLTQGCPMWVTVIGSELTCDQMLGQWRAMCVCVCVCVCARAHAHVHACLCVSHSVMSNSLWPHGLQPASFLCPWNSLGKNTWVGCHFLFQMKSHT